MKDDEEEKLKKEILFNLQTLPVWGQAYQPEKGWHAYIILMSMKRKKTLTN